MRNTILFGNGLGMAIDPVHFSLMNALSAVWDSVSADHKKLIDACLPGNSRVPQSESDLDTLHLKAMACRMLRCSESSAIKWLSSDGENLPDATIKFISDVAWRLFDSDKELDADFVNEFSEYLKESKSHVATLNYDNLLYSPLIKSGVLDGYNGSHVDGMTKTGFAPENLDRLYGKDFGYYLHLHGSPLFIDDDGQIVKQPQKTASCIPSTHLVLSHVRHKPSVIDASKVLREYWSRMRYALAESEHLFLIGYSGCDDHLNELIRTTPTRKKSIVVVEWDGAGSESDRKAFWSKKIGKLSVLRQEHNILDFRSWDKVD